TCPMSRGVPLPTADPLLPKAAELRANGCSWVAAARELDQHPDDLKRRADASRPAWRKLLGQARRDVIEGAFADALLALRADIRGDDPKLKQAAANMLLRLWMTLVRHRGRAPAGKPAAEPELSPWLRYCANIEKMSDAELEEMLAYCDEERDRERELKAKENKPPGDDGPGASGTPVPRPGGPKPSGGGCEGGSGGGALPGAPPSPPPELSETSGAGPGGGCAGSLDGRDPGEGAGCGRSPLSASESGARGEKSGPARRRPLPPNPAPRSGQVGTKLKTDPAPPRPSPRGHKGEAKRVRPHDRQRPDDSRQVPRLRVHVQEDVRLLADAVLPGSGDADPQGALFPLAGAAEQTGGLVRVGGAVEGQDLHVLGPDDACGHAAQVDPRLGQHFRDVEGVPGLVRPLDAQAHQVGGPLEPGRLGRLGGLGAGDPAHEDDSLSRHVRVPAGDHEHQVHPGVGQGLERRGQAAGAVVDLTGPDFDLAYFVRHGTALQMGRVGRQRKWWQARRPPATEITTRRRFPRAGARSPPVGREARLSRVFLSHR